MRILPAIVALLFVPAVTGAQEDPDRLDDIGTRLQFDFYTADLNALQRDLQSVVALDAPVELLALKMTYTGFGAWKTAELLRMPQPDQAGEAARQCVADLEKAVELEPKRAGLIAMLSACHQLVAELQGRIKAPLAAGRARQSLERAVALAPRDPHVLLIEGIAEFERARSSGGNFTVARNKLTASTAAFEVKSSSPVADAFATSMSWGPAEAWNVLGQLAVAQGDRAAARDAFERALVQVDDYADARHRLRELTDAQGP